jgi:alpha-L-fucosidase
MSSGISRRKFIKSAALAGAACAAWPLASELAWAVQPPFPGKFQPTWASLEQYTVPDWFRDAKFGIFLHWGIYSVPAHSSEWYPRLMYRRESPVFEWHRQHWGPQSMFGYKDFIPMFRAEKWKPEEWVELFKTAGAKYIVPVGEHHDGFPMYDSHLTEWNAARMGPCRDVIGELGREVRNQKLRLGVSSHRAFHWSYYTFETDFDTDNPLYAGLYGPIHAPTPPATNARGELRQTPSRAFIEDCYARDTEIVNLYQPDLVYFDWANGIPPFQPFNRQFAAYYYNTAARRGDGVVITYKGPAFHEHSAVMDFERGAAGSVLPSPWQAGTSVSWRSWGYIDDDSFKEPGLIIREFVDIVSKNGNLLLNVGPKPDGTIPDEAVAIFREIGRWTSVNGPAIFGSRPWKVDGEGPTEPPKGAFSEGKLKTLTYTPEDMRFTTRGDSIYAIFLAWPERQARIRALGSHSPNAPGKVSHVRLLGHDGNLRWHQAADALVIETPSQKPCDHAFAFEIKT